MYRELSIGTPLHFSSLLYLHCKQVCRELDTLRVFQTELSKMEVEGQPSNGMPSPENVSLTLIFEVHIITWPWKPNQFVAGRQEVFV